MTNQEEVRLRELFYSVADDVDEVGPFAELEKMLLDRPDLQDFYGRLVRINFLLDREWCAGGCIEELIPDCETPEGLAVLAACQSPFSREPAKTQRRTPSPYLQTPTTLWRGAIGVSLIILAVLALWNMRRPDVPDGIINFTKLKDKSLVVHHAGTLNSIERLNGTGEFSRLVYPLSLSEDNELTLCGGSVWMEHDAASLAHSYLLELPPNYCVDATIDAKSYFPNALNVIEVDRSGVIKGNTISFSSRNAAPALGGGFTTQVGKFSVKNETSHTRYFLFTGVYQKIDSTGDPAWRDSDCLVRVHAEDFLVIGWDDHGYIPDSGTAQSGSRSTQVVEDDRDYDDIRAVLHITSAAVKQTQAKTVQCYPEHSDPAEVIKPDGNEYSFVVESGQNALLMLSDNGWIPTTLRLVDSKSGEVLQRWSKPAIGDATAARNDIWLLRNRSASARRFLLLANAEDQSEPNGASRSWRTIPFQVVDSEKGRVQIGYEDNMADAELRDWNDVGVDLTWFTPTSDAD